MLTAVVTFSGSTFEVSLLDATFVTAEEGTEAEGPESDLNPIFPEVKEVVWGFGAFVVLALVMRLFLFRKVRDGMTLALRPDRGRPRDGGGVSPRRLEPTWPSTRPNSRPCAPTRRPGSKRPEPHSKPSAPSRSPRPMPASPTSVLRPPPRSMPPSRQLADRSNRRWSTCRPGSSELATGRRPSDEVVQRAVGEAMNQEVSA